MQKKARLYPNLYAELARFGESVSTLAEYMGRTPQNLHSKLKGTTKLTLKDMKAIQEFLAERGGAYTLDYLFYKNGD